LALRERLVRMDAGNTAWQRDVSVSHERLGDMLLAKGDSAGALEHFRASLAIARKLASQDPKNAMWQRDMSVGHDRLGDALSATGQARAAIEQLELSLDIRRRLTEQHPDNPQWQRDLAFSHARLGSLIEETGELDEARSRFERCEEAYRALGQDAGDCFNAAYCAAKLGNTERAFEWLGKLPTLGWRDAEALLGEATFASLHSDPRWSELIGSIRARH